MESQESPAQPPTPPPLPPTRVMKKPSSIAAKVRAAPPGWAFVGKVTKPMRDPLTPPSGTYFFYGTLRDPTLLAEILDLPTLPTLRPAYVVGYRTKLWGGYPALLDEPFAVVKGSAFEVVDLAAAARLAYYETSNYEPAPCLIHLADSAEEIGGFTFAFCGPMNDLEGGDFDLDAWMKRMGRQLSKPNVDSFAASEKSIYDSATAEDS